MPALNFKKRFADAITSGRKKQTIRAQRKRPFREGDRLCLYTGMRTTACQRLGEATATSVGDIIIAEASVLLDDHQLDSLEVAELAYLDGFNSISEFKDFFRATYGLPFRGQLIEWDEIVTS